MTELEQVVKNSHRLRPKTKHTYLMYVGYYVEFVGRHPANWTGHSLERWRDSLLQRGVAARTVVVYMAAVGFASKRRAQLDSRTADFARGAERPAYVQKLRASPLTLSQVKRLLGACNGRRPPDVRDRTMILLGLRAAFRREEIVTVAFEGLHDHQITVVAKGGKQHTVKIADEGWNAVKTWTGWLRKHGIASGRVFRNLRPSIEGAGEWHIGESITGDGFRKILSKRAEQAGLDDIHPHQLRHTYASIAIMSGVPPWRVQKVLGHKFRIGDEDGLGQLSSMTGRYVKDMNDESVDEAFPKLIDDD